MAVSSRTRQTDLGQTAVWLGGLMAAAVVGFGHRQPLVKGLGLAGIVVVATWLSTIDLRTHRLPNPIVGALAAAVTVTVLATGVLTDDPGRAGRAVSYGIAAAAVFLVANLVGGMGMGDVKYVFPLVTTLGWFGWPAIATAAMATAATGAVAATAALATGQGRKYRLPYGPFMSVGLVAGLLRAAVW